MFTKFTFFKLTDVSDLDSCLCVLTFRWIMCGQEKGICIQTANSAESMLHILMCAFNSSVCLVVNNEQTNVSYSSLLLF